MKNGISCYAIDDTIIHHRDNFDDIKVGDRLYIVNGSGLDYVTRITKTHFEVKNDRCKYRKKDGTPVGVLCYNGVVLKQAIKLTQQEINHINGMKKIHKMRDSLSKLDYSLLSDDKVKEIYDITYNYNFDKC